MVMELLKLIKESEYVVAFTGAGLSTESGIPDFRSSSGLYLSGKYEGHTPEEILSNHFVRQPKNQPIFFSFYKERIMKMIDKQPNRAHYALKKMQSVGKLKSVINQNIDNLLQKAGVDNVFDLHGNITSFRCTSNCGKKYGSEEFMKLLETATVPKCECGSIVRPNTVLFDEWLDDTIYDAAYHEAKKCDLMIAIGSSLVVRPACTLLSEISDTCKLVIINKDKTPYDHRADMVIHEPCGEVLEKATNPL
jgi:NAD-dependent deacetylase